MLGTHAGGEGPMTDGVCRVSICRLSLSLLDSGGVMRVHVSDLVECASLMASVCWSHTCEVKYLSRLLIRP